MPENVTVYEDAQDGSIKGWDIYDKNPSGAQIKNVFDSEKNSKVIEFQGAGIDNGYWLRKENNTYWDNREQFHIEWSMKFGDTYIIYIYLYTNKGFKYIQYEPVDSNALGSGSYIKIGLGSDTKDGHWHTITRDLQADLHLAQSDTNIIAVEAFMVRGNGRVDDIKLFKEGSAPTAPESPSDLTATATKNEVHLRWKDNSDNESGFKIFRDDTLIHTTAADVTKFTDTSLSAGTVYNYTVKATNSVGDSNGVSIAVQTEEEGSVTVYEDAEDGNIEGWSIYDSFPFGAKIKNVYDSEKQSKVIEFDGSGVGNGYWLRNSDGSFWDNRNQFKASWSMKFDDDFIIYFYILTSDGYKYLQYEPVNDDALGNGRYIKLGIGAGAKDGHWHTFERDLEADLHKAQPSVSIIAVEAFLIRGNGRVDDIKLSSEETPVQKPAAPSSLSATATKNEVELSWNDNSNNEAGFKIYRDSALIFTTTPNVTSYTDTLLTPSTTYFYTVKATNSAGDSDGVSISVTTQEDNQQTATVYENAEDGNIEGWSIYDDNPPNASISNVYDSDKGSRVIEFSGAGTDNGYWLRNADGSYWDNRKEFIIEWSLKYSENFVVYILVTTNNGNRYLRYDPIDSDALGSGTYIKHGIGSNLKDGNWHVARRDLKADLKEAQPDVELIAVEAFLIRGNGRVDDIKLIGENVTPAIPDKPTNLTGTSDTTSITLSWQDNSDNESGFKIYRDSALIYTTSANIMAYKDENLTPNTIYHYTVKAFNDVGESEGVSLSISTATSNENAYYVAPNGNDSWDGRADEPKGGNHGPWKTIQHAANMLNAGDTVYVREGTYVGAISITKSGSASGGYITFRNYPGEKPTITRNDQNTGMDTVRGSGVSYIKFIGFHLFKGVRGGIIFYGPGSHIEIRDNEVEEQNANIPENKRLGHAINVTAYKTKPMSHIIIDNNHVHHNHTGNPYVGGAYNEALTVLGQVEYFQITNNKVHDNDFIGLDVIGHQRGSFSVFGINRHGLVSGNQCYRNGVRKEWASSLYVDGAEYLIVENNLVYDNHGLGITISQETPESTADHVIVRNNFSWNNKRGGMLGSSRRGTVRDSVFVHNTVGLAQVETEFFLGTATNWRVKNNIFYEMGSAPFIYKDISNMTSSWQFDYNCYTMGSSVIQMSGKTYHSFSAYQSGSGKEQHSMEVSDPKLKDPSNQDYSLQNGSPCKDAGGFLTTVTASGSGTSVRVADARYFTDGFGVKSGDRIKVGNNPPVSVTSINYSSNTITVDNSISYNAGDGVSYVYEGTRPNIGAS